MNRSAYPSTNGFLSTVPAIDEQPRLIRDARQASRHTVGHGAFNRSGAGRYLLYLFQRRDVEAHEAVFLAVFQEREGLIHGADAAAIR